MKRVLVVGAGAREHALAWKLSRSEHVGDVLIAPGNVGTKTIGINIPVSITDREALARIVAEREVDLTVIGPEAALATGVQESIAKTGRLVVGPSVAAMQLESSKSLAKSVMEAAGVPTAASRTFTEFSAAVGHVASAPFPLVIKADGLASGKGVAVCESHAQAVDFLNTLMVERKYESAGQTVVIEEFLEGSEVSLMCLVDGERAVPLPLTQDHKRLLENDQGPNTGGMGAYAPVPFVDPATVAKLVRLAIDPVLKELSARGISYRGILFAGLMLTADGPKVLEYNCRFGDPETQAVMPLLADDLYELLVQVATGSLAGPLRIHSGAAAAVVAASAGYPAAPKVGRIIEGLADANDNRFIFHAATVAHADGTVATSGGRVLTMVGLGDTIRDAVTSALASPVTFDGMQRRKDIGRQGIAFEEGSARRCAEPGSPRFGTLASKASRRSRNPAQPRGNEFRLVVLASEGGSNLQALIDACSDGRLAAEIAGVISHDAGAGSLDRARRGQIPHAYIPVRSRSNPDDRRSHEAEVIEAIAGFGADLVVLAGWMLILSPEAIASIGVPIINVHPALLPVEDEPLDIPILRGAKAVREALRLRLPYTGVSVHYVTSEVDAGPVIAREAVAIELDDEDHSLHERLKRVEHRLLVESIQTIACGTSRQAAAIT